MTNIGSLTVNVEVDLGGLRAMLKYYENAAEFTREAIAEIEEANARGNAEENDASSS